MDFTDLHQNNINLQSQADLILTNQSNFQQAKEVKKKTNKIQIPRLVDNVILPETKTVNSVNQVISKNI